MYTGLKHLHSGLAYLVLLALLIATIFYLYKKISGQALSPKQKTIALIAMSLAHLQLLVGIVQYFISPYFKSALQDFGSAMKNETLRLYVIEHPIINIIAIAFITIGYSKVKKKCIANSSANMEFLFFAIGLLLIVSRIPWSAWL